MSKESIYQDAVTGVLAAAEALPEGQAEFSEEEQESLDQIAEAAGDASLMQDLATELADEAHNAALAAEEQADGFTLGQPGQIHEALLLRNRRKHDAHR